MLKKEIMIQNSKLTKKVRGEWVDKIKREDTIELVGDEKFDIKTSTTQNFGVIKNISPIFLIQNEKRYIKKVDIDSYPYSDNHLQGYSSKKDIYDNFVEIESGEKLSSKSIFREIEQVGNKKNGGDNSFFKKTSYLLKDNFKFAFYLECDYKLSNSIISLGADSSSFKLEVKESNEELNYRDKNGYLTLLSDAYITIPIRGNCDFAVTSEISYQSLINKKGVQKNRHTDKNIFKKSAKVYLYEKGSVFIKPSSALKENLKNSNLQQVGYNVFS